LVTYIGVHTIDGDLEKKILAKTFTDQNIKVSDYPPGIYTYWRNGFWIAVNYSSENYMMNLPANAKIIIGDKNLPSPGVLVWTE
jgi:beta-galactosidase